MEEFRDELVREVQQLNRAVSDLRQRVEALEREARVETTTRAAEAASTVVAMPAGAAAAAHAPVRVESFAPLFGWAFLGIAGAYLLRGITESGAIPGLLGAGLGVVYAGWWLFLAARRAWERPLFSTVHGLTAALILAPMLWEVTVRFRLMHVYLASAVLVSFSVWALAVGWRRNLHAIAWIGTLAGLITAGALFRETHEAAAWSATTLLIAVAVEFAACRDHWLGLRWVVACAADLTILVLTYLVAQRGTFTTLVLISQIALVVIYLSSTVDRTILRGLKISVFEIIQAVCAFVIAIGGALHIASETGSSPFLVGLVCLTGGIACYLISFAFLERHPERERNFHTYSTFAILLISAACGLLVSGAALAAAWSVLAIVMMCVGIVGARITLRVHAAMYLILGVVAGGLVPLGFERLIHLGDGPVSHLSWGYVAPLAAALCCYAAIVWLGRNKAAHWTDPLEAILSAAVSLWGVAGLAAGALSAWIAESAPLRTAVLVLLAVAAGWSGRRFRRTELTWLVYPLLALCGFKLIAEELRYSRSIALFVSLIFFGGALVLLPRWLRQPGGSAAESPAPEGSSSRGAAA
jgi:hypothetical protein